MLNEYDMSYLKIKHNPSQNLQSTTTSSKQNIETNYTNLIPIGSGAFGSVYKATCEENGDKFFFCYFSRWTTTIKIEFIIIIIFCFN